MSPASARCKLIAEKNLTNLRIGNHDAVEVVRDMLPEASLDSIHIFFPDPWHKTRHKKRRLNPAALVALLASRLKPGGYIHSPRIGENYALPRCWRYWAASPAWTTASPIPRPRHRLPRWKLIRRHGLAGFAPRPDYRPLTKFENRGLRRPRCVGSRFRKR